MTQQEQVSTLEQSQKLKELGCEQESIFVWCWLYGKNVWAVDTYQLNTPLAKQTTDYIISAYTGAELGEMLIQHGASMPTYDFHRKVWLHEGMDVSSPIETHARAELLIRVATLDNLLLSKEIKQ